MSLLTRMSEVKEIQVDKLVRVSVVATKLGFHPETLYSRIRRGLVPLDAVERYGRSIRVREDLLIEWMKGNGKPVEHSGVNNG